MSFNNFNKGNTANSSWIDELHGARRRRVTKYKIYNQTTHSMEEGEQISTMPIQDKDQQKMSRSEDQKDGVMRKE